MRKSHHHRYLYYLLGKLLQGFLIVTYVFFVVCLLLVIGFGMDTVRGVLVTGLPWLLKVGLTLGCGVGILSLIEALS
ncbi:MAG: hypothetical protein AAGA46_10100 [Cyanobacteria bacterium P01_F01_bin.13]